MRQRKKTEKSVVKTGMKLTMSVPRVETSKRKSFYTLVARNQRDQLQATSNRRSCCFEDGARWPRPRHNLLEHSSCLNTRRGGCSPRLDGACFRTRIRKVGAAASFIAP